MSPALRRSARLKLLAAGVGALVLAVAAGASGGLVARSLDTGSDSRRLPARFDDGRLDGFGPPRFDRGKHRWTARFGDLGVAAEYLELSQDELRDRLRDGDTLAEVARDEGKSVGGLVQALVDAATERLEEAVEDGDLTERQAEEIAARLEERFTDLVAGERRFRPDFRRAPFGP